MERATIDQRYEPINPERLSTISRQLTSGARCAKCVQRGAVVTAGQLLCRGCAGVASARRQRQQKSLPACKPVCNQ